MKNIILGCFVLLLGMSVASAKSGFQIEGDCHYGQYNVLTSIPSSLHKQIADRIIDTDLSTYINTAVSDAQAAGCRQVFFPIGLYTVSAPIKVTGTMELHGAMSGEGLGTLAVIRALGPYSADHLVSLEGNDTVVRGLELDGANIVDYGILLNRGKLMVSITVSNTKLTKFITNAIRGGFVVDLLMDRILVQMGQTQDYCIDIRTEYGPQPQSGYGVVTAELRNSNLNCGVRFQQSYPVRIVSNTFEFDYEGQGPAAAVACEGGRCTITDNYFELNVNENRTVPSVGILVSGGNYVISQNVLLNTMRPEGSIGIMLGTLEIGGSQGNYSVFQNHLRAWDVGIQADPASSTNGLSSALWGNMYQINNTDLSIKTDTKHDHGPAGVPRHGIYAYDPAVGFTFRNRAIVGTIARWNPSRGPIDLTYGNIFKVSADSMDVVSHTRALAGMRFSLFMDCPLSCPVLDADSWGLPDDLQTMDGAAYSFIVDDKNNVVGVQ